MISELLFLGKLLLAFLPFLLFVWLNSRANMKKKIRCRQFFMIPAAILYCIVLFVLMQRLSGWLGDLAKQLIRLLESWKLKKPAALLRKIYTNYLVLLEVVLFNTVGLFLFVFLKRIATAALHAVKIKPNTFRGRLVSLFYTWDDEDEAWYVQPHLGQARTFLKTAYYGGMAVVMLMMVVSIYLFRKGLIAGPFYPVFAIIVIGELAFFTDGLRKDEVQSKMEVSADRSARITLYPLLRKPLRTLFGDKLSSEGTTVNTGSLSGGSVEDVLTDLEQNNGHLGKNYAAFIRTKMEHGLRPNIDYLRSGYDLSSGKSLLFNTPFYDKLVPYAFYAMSRALMQGGKVLIVLGRHGITEDLRQWCRRGMLEVSNVPELWTVNELGDKPDESTDIGIIPRSGVHDLALHKANLAFLKQVSFVFIVEPSRLVTTAQIGLNLLIKCCGEDRKITFCSVDRNCDGLVDSLSHILMTNITEVSATEYPHGMSTYMCWTADSDYLQHRIIPGVSRYLGMGTELSFVALNNQVEKAVWYGGEAYPVLDAHWIAKQYYHDLLEYAKLPATQETFDKYFQASFNMCDERMSDESYISVEDERNNVFETRRNFATIAEKQGFVNVISSEYMLREYMTENTGLFTADPKAIPYLAADYANTRRNAVLTLCLKLCVEGVSEAELKRAMLLIGLDPDNAEVELWQELYSIFCGSSSGPVDADGNRIITLTGGSAADTLAFEKASTLHFSRRYSIETGSFESVYTIEDPIFAAAILDDLQNAVYIAEQASRDSFIGTELKGHIYQKYLPSQFFTLNGKYYEMVSVTADNRILVRRASEHINGRLSYRQIRRYHLDRISDAETMGALKTVNNIDIYRQFADFRVETPAYWRFNGAYNDFRNGDVVEINGVPERRYYSKQILKLDFSKLGDAFTDAVRLTLTALLNEVFVTLFADNKPFISAVTPGDYRLPQTYSLDFGPGAESSEKCIFLIEDSQLDIGLLIAVERNVERILQIISDYLSWNKEMIERSLAGPKAAAEKAAAETVAEAAKKIADAEPPKKCFFEKIKEKIAGIFHRKKKDGEQPEKGPKKKLTKEEKRQARAAKKAEKKAKKEAKKLARKLKKEGKSPEDLPQTPTTEAGGPVPEGSALTGSSADAPEGIPTAGTDAPQTAEAPAEPLDKKAAKKLAKQQAKEAKLAAKATKKAEKLAKKNGGTAAQPEGESPAGESEAPIDKKAARKLAKQQAKEAKLAAKAAKKAEKEAKKLAKKSGGASQPPEGELPTREDEAPNTETSGGDEQ